MAPGKRHDPGGLAVVRYLFGQQAERRRDALRILDRLDEEWWLNASLASQGNMNITVEPA